MRLSVREIVVTSVLAGVPCVALAGPPEATPVTDADLPAGVAPRGKLQAAWKFSDKLGTNYVLFSGMHVVKLHPGTMTERTTWLYVDDWVVPASGKPHNLLPMRDVVEKCPLGVTAKFHDAAFEVTDLDHDGIAEVTFGYELGCRSDVRPATYKVLTLEGGALYALRGQTRIADGTGGDYKPDPKFAKAPAAFLDHAKQVWVRTDGDSLSPPP